MVHVLITGTSRGIGAEIAAALRARGARVIGHATRHEDENTIAADFAESFSPQMLWQEARERLDGRIDVLVNNAGVFAKNPIGLNDLHWLDGWEDGLRINLTAAAQLSRMAVRHFQSRGEGGRLVHIASRAGQKGDSPQHWHYAAAKGGLIAMHKTIARAYAAEGILSYAIAPGFTNTVDHGGGVADYLASRGGEKLLEDIPLGRVAEVDEIAAIAAFCALDAPASMTGAVLDVNGASYVR